MNDFYFKFNGNKRKELANIADIVGGMLRDGMQIVEPFGGSVAFSRWLYRTHRELKYHISDVDVPLVEFCNGFHLNSDIIIKRAKELIEMMGGDKKAYSEHLKKYKKGDVDIADMLPYQLVFKKWCGVTYGRWVKDVPKFTKYVQSVEPTNDFFKNVPYRVRHYKDVFEEFKDNPDALLFLDPPYMSTCNEWYYFKDKPNDGGSAIETMWSDIRNLFEHGKCRVILVVKHDMWMDLLFAKYRVLSYKKFYAGSKNNVMHDVYVK